MCSFILYLRSLWSLLWIKATTPPVTSSIFVNSSLVSEFIYYPKQDITIILLKNSGIYGEYIWPVTMGISSIVFGLPYDMWKPRTEIKLDSSILREKEGRYAAEKLAITFLVKDNQLYEILSNGAELPLLAESEDYFYRYIKCLPLVFQSDTKFD